MKLFDAGVMIFVFIVVFYTFVHLDKEDSTPTPRQIYEVLK